MKNFLFSLLGVAAMAVTAHAADSKTEIAAAVADLVVLKDGKLVPFESTASPDFYIAYHSASW